MFVCVCVCVCRLGVPSAGGVWGLPAAHSRPLPDARQRVLVARRVFAVRRVSAAAHHQLLLPRQKTLLQTWLPTVRADGLLFLKKSTLKTIQSVIKVPCILFACLFKSNDLLMTLDTFFFAQIFWFGHHFNRVN